MEDHQALNIPAVVTRFAPSPTGPLHLGHARAAFFAHDLARRSGGRFLLRIEDIDGARCSGEWERAIGDDLAWLGLRPDAAPHRQSDGTDAYRRVLDDLRARRLLYPCFCTRAAIAREIAGSVAASHDPDGAPLYPGTCRTLDDAARAARIARAEPHAWRLDMAAALASAGHRGLTRQDLDGSRTPCHPERFGDVVLARRDTPASYHLCATHDDARFGVTLVTRGVDLEPAADLHRLLQALLAWPEPRYRFHPLLLGADGRRLSKRDGAASLASLRAGGAAPPDIRRLAGVDALLAATCASRFPADAAR